MGDNSEIAIMAHLGTMRSHMNPCALSFTPTRVAPLGIVTPPPSSDDGNNDETGDILPRPDIDQSAAKNQKELTVVEGLAQIQKSQEDHILTISPTYTHSQPVDISNDPIPDQHAHAEETEHGVGITCGDSLPSPPHDETTALIHPTQLIFPPLSGHDSIFRAVEHLDQATSEPRSSVFTDVNEAGDQEHIVHFDLNNGYGYHQPQHSASGYPSDINALVPLGFDAAAHYLHGTADYGQAVTDTLTRALHSQYLLPEVGNASTLSPEQLYMLHAQPASLFEHSNTQGVHQDMIHPSQSVKDGQAPRYVLSSHVKSDEAVDHLPFLPNSPSDLATFSTPTYSLISSVAGPNVNAWVPPPPRMSTFHTKRIVLMAPSSQKPATSGSKAIPEQLSHDIKPVTSIAGPSSPPSNAPKGPASMRKIEGAAGPSTAETRPLQDGASEGGSWSQSKRWMSQETIEKKAFQKTMFNLRYIGADKSPFLPQNPAQLAQIRAEAADAKSRQRARKMGKGLADATASGTVDESEKKVTSPALLLGGKDLQPSLSPVFAARNCFNKELEDERADQTTWPSLAELKEHGDKRAHEHGRNFPLPQTANLPDLPFEADDADTQSQSPSYHCGLPHSRFHEIIPVTQYEENFTDLPPGIDSFGDLPHVLDDLISEIDEVHQED